MIFPAVFTVPALAWFNYKKKREEITMDKQRKHEKLNAWDRFVAGERIPVTTAKVITGHCNDHIPTEGERRIMSSRERVRQGETYRHVFLDNMKHRMDERSRKAYQRQENGQRVTPLDRIATGEGLIATAVKVTRGRRNDPLVTPEERAKMTYFQRIRSGERINRVFNEAISDFFV
uniref:Uncharacterized protein n=1 Tax=Helicotheca tamesis TaxID=374047 RepID=A0A7S2HZN3_9STRA|mmetsp:Transcript_4305/g.5897  ORF Transcript_4305/g.5897 Transcript_4305/m.5897 type:complete len:176 (+) Transcript_4305:122-649(+)|eukprot:CAMPEP_0185739936 /NCGR_PEP_ID=MMETSP1171-20130828/36586_1 /TAXON_ID=374046 /ORGANISM="Helicotheca tamensis, Strain CCMP826" /LENGTH=175 /DNA_ID=CAMNT_0028411645 /DNA_START=85 /DNA_END=612 /DNA_ORIENTATION=+